MADTTNEATTGFSMRERMLTRMAATQPKTKDETTTGTPSSSSLDTASSTTANVGSVARSRSRSVWLRPPTKKPPAPEHKDPEYSDDVQEEEEQEDDEEEEEEDYTRNASGQNEDDYDDDDEEEGYYPEEEYQEQGIIENDVEHDDDEYVNDDDVIDGEFEDENVENEGDYEDVGDPANANQMEDEDLDVGISNAIADEIASCDAVEETDKKPPSTATTSNAAEKAIAWFPPEISAILMEAEKKSKAERHVFRQLRSSKRYSNVSDETERSRILKAMDDEEREKFRLLLETRLGVSSGHVVGTCDDMCPEPERYFRKDMGTGAMDGYTHWLETQGMVPFGTAPLDPLLAVKEYRKEAADNDIAVPSQLRPAHVLHQTIVHMCKNVLSMWDSDAMCNVGDEARVATAKVHWHKFVWDRTRAIRKDMSIQQLTTPLAVLVLERIIRFHILASHHMCECVGFVDQQNNEQMNKSMKTLRDLYDTLREDLGMGQPNEAEFKAYDLLASLDDRSATLAARNWPHDIMASSHVKFALEMYALVQEGQGGLYNYVRFFKQMKEASFLQSCLLHRHFTRIRGHALDIMNTTYSSHMGHKVAVSLVKIQSTLGFDTLGEARMFVKMHNLSLSDGDSNVEFCRGTYMTPEEKIEPTLSKLITSKVNASLGEIVYGGPLPEDDIRSVTDTFSTRVRTASPVLGGSGNTEITTPVSKTAPRIGTGSSPRKRKSLVTLLGMQKTRVNTRPKVPDASPETLDELIEAVILELLQREAKPIATLVMTNECDRLKQQLEVERKASAREAELQRKLEEEDRKRKQQAIKNQQRQQRRDQETKEAAVKAKQQLDHDAITVLQSLTHECVVHELRSSITTAINVERACIAVIETCVAEVVAAHTCQYITASIADVTRLFSLERILRGKRVLRRWSHAAKKQRNARLQRVFPSSALASHHRHHGGGISGRVPLPSPLTSSSSLTLTPVRDTDTVLHVQEDLAIQIERRRHVAELQSRWTPVDLRGLAKRYGFNNTNHTNNTTNLHFDNYTTPNPCLNQNRKRTLHTAQNLQSSCGRVRSPPSKRFAVCMGSSENTMLYNYVHTRLVQGLPTTLPTTPTTSSHSTRSPMTPNTNTNTNANKNTTNSVGDGGRGLSVTWVDSAVDVEREASLKLNECAAIVFLLTVDVDAPPHHLHERSWPTESELASQHLSFSQWLAMSGERVPHGVGGVGGDNDDRGWWRRESSHRLSMACNQQQQFWKSANQRLVEVVDATCTTQQHPLLILFDPAGSSITKAELSNHLHLTQLRDRVSTCETMLLDPTIDVNLIHSGLEPTLEQGLAWMLKNVRNVQRQWRGSASNGLSTVYRMLLGCSSPSQSTRTSTTTSSTSTTPTTSTTTTTESFKVCVFNAAIGFLTELIEQHERAMVLQRLATPRSKHCGAGENVLHTLALLSLPSFPVDDTDRSNEYDTHTHTHTSACASTSTCIPALSTRVMYLKHANLDAHVMDYQAVANTGGDDMSVVDFVITQRLLHLHEVKQPISFNETALDTAVQEYEIALHETMCTGPASKLSENKRMRLI